MKVIYEPKDRAGEYTGKYAANFFRGCGHGCEYCFAPQILRMKKEEFFGNPKLRSDLIIEDFIKDLEYIRRNEETGEVFLSFTCDPYQPIEAETRVTREAIFQLIQRGQHFSILTKGGERSERDFDLLAENHDLCRYGATLVFANDDHSKQFEPGAASTSERINSLMKAHWMGIKTWVSLEPAWSYADAWSLINRTHEFVDEYRIGKLNYHPHAKEVDWKAFKEGIVDHCESLGVNYVLKNDLQMI
jgi:DNA repair photolyase